MQQVYHEGIKYSLNLLFLASIETNIALDRTKWDEHRLDLKTKGKTTPESTTYSYGREDRTSLASSRRQIKFCDHLALYELLLGNRVFRNLK